MHAHPCPAGSCCLSPGCKQARPLLPRTTPGSPCPSVLNPFLPTARLSVPWFTPSPGAHAGGGLCRCENTFLLPTLFSDRLAGPQILGWKSFSFRIWKALLYYLPGFHVKLRRWKSFKFLILHLSPACCPFCKCAGSLP